MKTNIKHTKNIAAFLCSAVFFVFTACEDKAVSSDKKQKNDFASQILYNADIIQRDSGEISLKFKAPIIEKYEYIDSPYVVAKKGFYLEYFDKKKPEIPGKIWANHAVFYEKKNFYEAIETRRTHYGISKEEIVSDEKIIYGDINGDTKVDITDLTLMSLYLLGDVKLNQSQLKAANVLNESKISIAALAHFKQYIMHDPVKLGPQ